MVDRGLTKGDVERYGRQMILPEWGVQGERDSGESICEI